MVYFKFFPENLIVKGFQYKLGNNKDIHSFNKSQECGKGGLYYTDIQNIMRYEDFGKMIGVIEIPEGVPIVKLGYKYKSPEINIIALYDYKEFLKREDLYPEEKKKITDIEFILRMPTITTVEMIMEAVKKYGGSKWEVDPPITSTVTSGWRFAVTPQCHQLSK